MFVKKIGIDLGTVNTLVYTPKKGIVANEPSIVAFDGQQKKVIAVGARAQEMLGRTPENIQAISPLKDGIIADYKITEIMLNYFIGKAVGSFQFFKPDIIISVPAGISSSERRAVIQSGLNIGAKKTYLVKEPILAALGAGLKIQKAAGHMIIDIGGGTSEIAVISLGSIVASESIKVGGIKITQAIQSYVRNKYNLDIGFISAEAIKLSLGKKKDSDSQEDVLRVKGQDVIEGLPATIEIRKNELIAATLDVLEEIAQAAKRVLQNTPPELSSDILEKGIWLSGGAALSSCLPRVIQKETGIECRIAENPMLCVVLGIGHALKNIEAYKKILLAKKPVT